MKFARDIIIKPIISEKSHTMAEMGKYTFKVAVDADRRQVKDAIEEIFSVKVVKVNTMNVKGKPKKLGRRQLSTGHTADWKKAVVTLAAGQTIDVYGGV